MRNNEERRRNPRRGVVATAAIFSADKLHGTYRVRDLSAGGARLGGAIELPVGSEVSLLLQVRGRAPFTLSARVLRREGRGSARSFSVAFVALSAEDEDAIHEALIEVLERESARDSATVLVLYGDGEGRDTLERELEGLGLAAVAVSTPLEALDYLERADTRIATVLVDLSLGASQGLDLLEFVEEHHPRVRRIIIADEPDPSRPDRALRSGRAHAVLRRPFAAGELGATLTGAALA
jgi:CheY-like chemotaxis protein